MRKRLAILIFLASVLQTLAANYYVTQSGAGNRDGSSAANAWAVSDFNATTKPTGGDTVFFSGTLSNGLNPSANGTSGAQLLLDLKGATVSTTVTINSKSYLTLSGGTTASSMTSGTAIGITRCNYITIDGWTFESSDINGWPTFASSSYSTNLTYANCTVQNCGYAFLGNNDDTILITGCDVLSSQNGTTNVGNQTDLLHLGGASNVIVEKSRFVLRAPGSSKAGSDGSRRHNDVIQTFATGGSNGRKPSNWTIRYCWVENQNVSPASDGNSSWTMLEALTGTPALKIYDNVFTCPSMSGPSGANNGVRDNKNPNAGDTHYFYNNTVIKRANPNGIVGFYAPGTAYWKNNILWSPSGVGSGNPTSTMTTTADYNFFYRNGSSSSLTGPHGSTTVDPLLKDPDHDDYSLAANSPCIGKGDNSLGAEYAYGIAPGSTWPNPTVVARTGAWDVGAFVSNAGPAPSPTPAPPRSLRILHQARVRD